MYCGYTATAIRMYCGYAAAADHGMLISSVLFLSTARGLRIQAVQIILAPLA